MGKFLQNAYFVIQSFNLLKKKEDNRVESQNVFSLVKYRNVYALVHLEKKSDFHYEQYML